MLMIVGTRALIEATQQMGVTRLPHPLLYHQGISIKMAHAAGK